MSKVLLDRAEPKVGRANFRLRSFATVSVFMFWLFCSLWVISGQTFPSKNRPLSAVAPIADIHLLPAMAGYAGRRIQSVPSSKIDILHAGDLPALVQ